MSQRAVGCPGDRRTRVDVASHVLLEVCPMRRSGLLALMVIASLVVAGCGTATLLPDGRVLLRSILAKAYDPAAGRVSNLAMPTTLRVYESATLLDNGLVLIAGGAGGDSLTSGSSGGETLSSADLYDPSTDTYAPTGPMAQPRALHTATRLADGRVLIVGGGVTGSGSSATPSVETLPPPEIYDPATGTFAPAGGNTTIARLFSTATLLPDGKVLIAGGMTAPAPAEGASPDPDATGSPTTVAELFDPATGTFTATGSMTMPRIWHTATALPDGRVLFVGGTVDMDMTGGSSTLDPTTQSAEIYDPASGTFTAVGTTGIPRVGHAAALLGDGRVLITGGTENDSATPESFAKSAEIFDPGAGTFSATGDMVAGHAFHTATTMSDGRVLIAGFDEAALGGMMGGGQTMPDLLSSVEVYDPGTGAFAAVEVEPAVIPLPSPAG